MTTTIALSFENTPVTFTQDAYINATQIAKHFNKVPKDYLRLEQTKEYITELTKGRISPLKENQLVIVKKGGKAGNAGTWLHPKLTVDFARWLSAKFAVWCDEQIENILKGNRAQPEPEILPAHDGDIYKDKYIDLLEETLALLKKQKQHANTRVASSTKRRSARKKSKRSIKQIKQIIDLKKEGYTCCGIAEMLGITEGAVRYVLRSL